MEYLQARHTLNHLQSRYPLLARPERKYRSRVGSMGLNLYKKNNPTVKAFS